jgi:hypothetical protein
MKVDLIDDQVETIVRSEMEHVMQSMKSYLEEGKAGQIFSDDPSADTNLIYQHLEAAELMYDYYGGELIHE